jgi:hypothetical protein
MNPTNAGYIVKTQDGRIGRTFHCKGLINRKVPVFVAIETKEEHDMTVPISFSEKGVLIQIEKLELIGHID